MPKAQLPLRVPSRRVQQAGRKYAFTYVLTIDLDGDKLAAAAPNLDIGAARVHVRRLMEERGFTCRQDTVFIGNDDLRSKECIKAVIELGVRLPWFRAAARDIRMLQVAEDEDLIEFLGYAPVVR
jgi:virulence-associated protein VapD